MYFIWFTFRKLHEEKECEGLVLFVLVKKKLVILVLPIGASHVQLFQFCIFPYLFEIVFHMLSLWIWSVLIDWDGFYVDIDFSVCNWSYLIFYLHDERKVWLSEKVTAIGGVLSVFEGSKQMWKTTQLLFTFTVYW